MKHENSMVALYDTHEEAEQAVKKLQKSGFDMKQLSIVGKDYHTAETVVGYYNIGDRMKSWGGTGAFWNLGFIIWFSLFYNSCHRTAFSSRTIRNCLGWSFGRGSCGGWNGRYWCSVGRHWHSKR
jgi:hypothetical protein